MTYSCAISGTTTNTSVVFTYMVNAGAGSFNIYIIDVGSSGSNNTGSTVTYVVFYPLNTSARMSSNTSDFKTVTSTPSPSLVAYRMYQGNVYGSGSSAPLVQAGTDYVYAPSATTSKTTTTTTATVNLSVPNSGTRSQGVRFIYGTSSSLSTYTEVSLSTTQTSVNLSSLTGSTTYYYKFQYNGSRSTSVWSDMPGTSSNFATNAGLTATAVATNATTYGSSTGSISLTVSNGTAPYTYVWKNSSNVQVSTSQSPTGLPAGTYTVVITDASSNTYSTSATVKQQLGTISATVTNATTYGSSTGAVTLFVPGGIGTLSYSWKNSNNSIVNNSQNLTSVKADTYTVSVTDSASYSGNVATTSATVGQQLGSISATATNAAAYGSSTGSIALSVLGGVSLTYLWRNSGNAVVGSNQNLTAVPSGTYTVTVTDSSSYSGNVLTTSAAVKEQLGPATLVVTNATTYGSSDGSVTLSVQGGIGTLSYLWSNGATTKNLTAVPADTYTVTVTDSSSYAGNVLVTTATVKQQLGSATATPTNASVYGSTTGSVALAVLGGIDLTYSWVDNTNVVVSTSQNLTSVAAGTYTVTVTDSFSYAGNVLTSSATVREPLGPVVATSTDATAYGSFTGAVTLFIVGGIGTLSYLWSNGSITQNLTGVMAGSYSVTVTDSASYFGNSKTASATVGQPPGSLTLNFTVNHVSTYGGSDGSVVASVPNAIATLHYQWSTGEYTASIANLSVGTYSLKVTQNGGETKTATVTVGEPFGPVRTTIVDAPDQTREGLIRPAILGGVPPYSYAWSDGSSSEALSALPGAYSLLVTDWLGTELTIYGTIRFAEPFGFHESVAEIPATSGTTLQSQVISSDIHLIEPAAASGDTTVMTHQVYAYASDVSEGVEVARVTSVLRDGTEGERDISVADSDGTLHTRLSSGATQTTMTSSDADGPVSVVFTSSGIRWTSDTCGIYFGANKDFRIMYFDADGGLTDRMAVQAYSSVHGAYITKYEVSA